RREPRSLDDLVLIHERRIAPAPLPPHPRGNRLRRGESNQLERRDHAGEDDYTRTGFGGSPGIGLSSSARFSLPGSAPSRDGSLRTAAGDGGISRPSRNAVTIASTSLPSSTSFSSSRAATAWSSGR